MLARTADGIFWMFRYLERAENTARLLDAGLRMSLTASSGSGEEWLSVLASAECEQAHRAKYEEITGTNVIEFLLRDTDNRSCVLRAIESARTNARAVRTALTRETFESINDSWMNIQALMKGPVTSHELPEILGAIRRQVALVRGAFLGTTLRNEIFAFARLGTFIERADSTARILDVKYYVLLPAASYVGTSIDVVQWESILRSASAHRSYRWEYDADYKPSHIVDYLVFNPRMPRSLFYCYQKINSYLDELAEEQSAKNPAGRHAQATLAGLKQASVETIISDGLHEFLQAFLTSNTQLGNEIAQHYRFYR